MAGVPRTAAGDVRPDRLGLQEVGGVLWGNLQRAARSRGIWRASSFEIWGIS